MKKHNAKLVTRIPAILLAAVMAAGFSACGSNDAPAAGGTSSGAGASGTETDNLVAPSTTTGTVNEYGYEPTKETLKISVYAGDSTDQQTFMDDKKGGKALYDNWLKENMNVEFDWHFYSNDMTEKLNMMLAAGDYPEVITNMPDDMANKFASQGRAVDLTGYVDQYGDNITRRMGDYLNLLRNDDGKLFKLATVWGETPNVAGYDFGIRYDYWNELGEAAIYKTPEEYYEALKKILANHPTNDNGEKTYAVTATNASTDQGMTMVNTMLGAYGFVNGYKAGEDGSFSHWLNTTQGLEMSKLLNKMWREGMIDPDYLSTTYEDYISKLSTGRVIGNLGTWWYAWVGGHETWAVAEGESYDINKRFMNVSVAAPGVNMDETTLLNSNYIGSYRCIITDKCQNPADVMKFINWENSEVGNMISGWGAPAETNNWNIDENGKWVVSDDIMNVDQKNLYFHDTLEKNGGQTYMLATAGGWLKTDGRSNFDMIDSRVDRVSVYDYWPVDPETGAFSDAGVNICWGNYTAPAFDSTLYTVTFDPEATITQTNQTVKDTMPSYWANIMTAASEADCEKAFNDAAAALNTMGLHDLEAFYQQSYEANKTKMEG